MKILNKGLLALIFILFIAIQCNSKGTSSGLFWKIKKNNKTSYILGSIHVAKQEIYPLPKTIINAFNKSQNLVVEVNINKIKYQQIKKLIQKNGTYKNDNLKTNLPLKLYLKILTQFKNYNIPESQLLVMKPWLAALTISKLNLKNLGYNSNLGIDLFFLSKAKNKKILELETMNFQLELLSKMDKKTELLFLKYSIYEIENIKKEMKQLFHFWENGNANAINELLKKNYKKHKELEPLFAKLIINRNKTMTKSIEKILKLNPNSSSFIIVGSAHLLGKKGIINMLKLKGYTITKQ